MINTMKTLCCFPKGILFYIQNEHIENFNRIIITKISTEYVFLNLFTYVKYICKQIYKI